MIKTSNTITKLGLGIAGAAAALTMLAPKAQAVSVTVISNTGISGNQPYPLTGVDRNAISFTTANDGITRILENVTVRLTWNDEIANADGINNLLKFDFYSTLSGSLPTGSGTNIFSQAVTPISELASGALYTFNFSSLGITLAPNTSYALAVYGISGGSFSIRANCPPGGGCPGAAPYTGTGTYLSNASSTSVDGLGNPIWSSQSARRIWGITAADAPTPVPFEFSPSYGILLLGGIWGANKLRKKGSLNIKFTQNSNN